MGEHVLVPSHEKVSEKERDELFERHNITFVQLPKIKSDDPAIKDLGVKDGDVIRVKRSSVTAGSINYYRGVSDE